MRISQATSIILFIIIVVGVLLFLSFQGYSKCSCQILYENITNSYRINCPTHGNASDFWAAVNQGISGKCT